MILLSEAIIYRIALFVTTFYLSTQLWVGISLLSEDSQVHDISHHASRSRSTRGVDKHASLSQQALSSTKSFPPLQVLTQYRHMHGDAILQRELQDSPSTFHNRKFLVVYYSCPHEAGNLLHDMMNQIIAGMALNRTILLKYNTPNVCSASRLTGKNQTRCFKANTQAECEDSLLRKAKWLPMYDEWIHHIDSSTDDVTTTLPLRDSKAYTLQDWKDKRLVAVRSSQFYIPRARGSIWKDEIFQPQHTPQAEQSLKRLYAARADLLYGMLFHQLLEFNREIAPPELQEYNNPSAKTFVLHSRHAHSSDQGDDVRNELQCLEEILPKRNTLRATSTQENCIIYLMSDRETTVEVLKRHIHTTYPHCTPVVATHAGSNTNNSINTSSPGHYQEHGKWAGVGFMQDLMLGSRAKDGFIGHCHRSSSQLLREMVEFNRHFEQDENGGAVVYKDAMPPLKTCCLP